MAASDPLNEHDLSAYADRQLAPERAAQVEAWLARDAEAMARVGEIRQQNARLGQALSHWLDEPIPERLLEAAVPPAQASRGGRWRIPAALAATLLVGVAAGWFARESTIERQGTPLTFPREVALSHVLYTAEPRRPVEVWANEEASLVRWLSRRTAVDLTAPNLNDLGFALVGGRLLSGNQKPTGLFMYENADKQRLTLQWRKSDPGTSESAFRYAHENGVGVFYWIDAHSTYALSGNLERDKLLAVARVVYGQLAAAEAKPR
jgi:anti-sigma factor RsiW